MNIKTVITFTSGLIIGSGVTYYFTKKYFRKITDEEIESVKEVYNKRDKIFKEIMDDTVEKVTTTDVEDSEHLVDNNVEYESILHSNSYRNKINERDERIISEIINNPEEGNYTKKDDDSIYIDFKDHGKAPEIIDPNDFGEDEYDTQTLRYFTDHILAYDNGRHVIGVEDLIGDALEHFGEIPGCEDAVYVRSYNDEKDYEILRMDCDYIDIYPDTYENGD